MLETDSGYCVKWNVISYLQWMLVELYRGRINHKASKGWTKTKSQYSIDIADHHPSFLKKTQFRVVNR